ncbi:MAG: hypothetical protein ACRDNP_14180 [Gaiellaceae bacterium]
MVPEASLERAEHGLAPAGRGWFVLNAREARWTTGAPTPWTKLRFSTAQP